MPEGGPDGKFSVQVCVQAHDLCIEKSLGSCEQREKFQPEVQ